MYKSWQIKTGYVGVVNQPKTLIGRVIGKFTKGNSHTIKFVWGIYENRFGLWVFEMKQLEGELDCKRTLWQESEYKNSNNWVLREPIKPYTAAEMDKFKEACDYGFYHYEYDTTNLIRHMIMYFFSRFPLERKKDNKVVCSQFTAICANAVRPYTFINPECVSPLHVRVNKNYKDVKPLK